MLLALAELTAHHMSLEQLAFLHAIRKLLVRSCAAACQSDALAGLASWGADGEKHQLNQQHLLTQSSEYPFYTEYVDFSDRLWNCEN